MNSYPSRMVSWGLSGLMGLLFALSLGWISSINYGVGMRSWDLALSSLLLALPLGLLYFSIGVLILGLLEHRQQGRMSEGLAKLIYYTPRIAGILIILFVGLFSLDVFGQGYSFWETVGAFLMHNLPTIVMTILLILAWRKPIIGFIIFLLAAVFFLRVVLGQPIVQSLPQILLFSGPMTAIALLFWTNWKWQKPVSAARNHLVKP